jgi:transposase-like protein
MINSLTIIFFLIILLSKNPVQHSERHTKAISEDSPQRVCPSCGSHHVIKNGSIHDGKPKHQCNDCGRQFVDHPNKKVVSDQTRQLIDSLLLERISMRGIARVTGVSWDWLQKYVNSKMSCIPRRISVTDKSKGRLTLECDEIWSFVLSKKNQVDAPIQI